MDAQGRRLAQFLERALRPSVSVGGRAISTFHLFGGLGFAAAIACGLVLGARLGLSPAVIGALAAASSVSSLALVLLVRALLGEERLVYYHHELAVLIVVGLAAAALGRLPLPYLDVSTLALGLLLACGRLGCLMVGCCHGLPHRFGLRYRVEHGDAGLARGWVGVPLLPVQAVESVAVLALTLAAAARLTHRPPGATLAGQVVAYALLRFGLEQLRGDGARPQLGGLSEAQLTSTGLAILTVLAERIGWLPASAWHPFAAAALVLACATVGLARRGPHQRLLSARHVEELAEALLAARDPVAPGAAPRVCTTSLGVRLSSGRVTEERGETRLYTFSGVDARAARALSSLILDLQHHAGGCRLAEPRPGVFQLLLFP